MELSNDTIPAASKLGISIKGLKVLDAWVKQQWELGRFQEERKFPDGTVCRIMKRSLQRM